MSCWAKLAIASVRAEFPHWELLQAYHVFHIDAQHTRNTVLQLSDSFDRLGNVLSVYSADLKTQYVDHLAISTQEVQAGSSCPHAWATSVRRSQTRATTRLNYPVDALGPVVDRYVVSCGCSTSGVEQIFCHAQGVREPSRHEDWA